MKSRRQLQEEYDRLYEAYTQAQSHIRRLERERYHLRSVMMMQAVEDWLNEEEYYGDPIEAVEEQVPQRNEVQVRGFAPDNNDTNVKMK